MTNPILDMLNSQKKSQPEPTQNDLPTSLDDPRMNKTKEYVKQHGGDPKAAFFNLCREKALNPAEILNKFMKRG